VKIVAQITHKFSGESIEVFFERLPVLIGRSKICDLIIPDSMSSRQHCVLELASDQSLKLVDLQSGNGTFVKGQKISVQELWAGDSFQVGDHEIRLLKISRPKEESTVHQLEALVSKPPGEVTEVTDHLTKEEKHETPAAEPDDPHVDLKTPAAVRISDFKPVGQSKNWVQVSFFWQESLIDVQCFDRGDQVAVGRSTKNDFCVDASHLPDEFSLLKIHPQGIEIQFHPAMSGSVETRQGVESLDDLKKRARHTGFGLSTFVPFQDRCLIEMGPFSFFIRSLRLRIQEPLEAPLVKEPLFSGILSAVSLSFVVFVLFLGSLLAAKKESPPEERPFVRLELPEKKPQAPPRPPPPEKTPVREAKTGEKAQRAQKLAGSEGAGQKAGGDEGKRGREDGKREGNSREIGFQTREKAPAVAQPKGAFGEVDSRAQARRSNRSGGGATLRVSPEKSNQQAPSRQATPPKPQVRVEEQGLFGAFQGSGGGGDASSGGEMAGAGLSGQLQGALSGLERGALSDSRGSGGRGSQGRSFGGGGGQSIEVGGLGTAGKGGGRSGFGLGSSGTKGEAEVTYVAEEIEVRDGLTREEIERVVRSHQNEIRACYERALIQSGNMDLAGRLRVSWFVNREGRAENVRRESDFGSEAGLYDCLASRIRTWQFPRPRGGLGAQVAWPFVFRRGG